MSSDFGAIELDRGGGVVGLSAVETFEGHAKTKMNVTENQHNKRNWAIRGAIEPEGNDSLGEVELGRDHIADPELAVAVGLPLALRANGACIGVDSPCSYDSNTS